MFSKKKGPGLNYHKATFAKAKDYDAVFNNGVGKRVLHDLMNSHFMARAVFHEKPNEIYFREGQRNVILRILHILQQDPEELFNRLKEAQDEYRFTQQ